MRELKDEVKERKIPMSKVAGLGTDGAAVMTGLDRAVAGRMKEENPHLVKIHCVAHRLALCTEQAANRVKAIKRFQETLTSVFYHFRNSPLKELEFHKIQKVLDQP